MEGAERRGLWWVCRVARVGLDGRAGWSPGLVHVRVCDNCMTAEAVDLGSGVDVPLWGGASV